MPKCLNVLSGRQLELVTQLLLSILMGVLVNVFLFFFLTFMTNSKHVPTREGKNPIS